MNTTFLRKLCAALLFCIALGMAQDAQATGITADVGLTPPTDRWIFRTQLRHMERDDPTPMDRSMQMRAVPVVLAYGLRPELTTIVRQMFVSREMNMPAGETTTTGMGNLALIGKYRLLRINRPDYIFGIAPTLGIELPSGDDEISVDTWDLLAGVYFSGRRGALGADLNLEYRISGIEDRSGDRSGDEFSATLAVAWQLSLDEQATKSLWPVLELHYAHASHARAGGQELGNSGEDALLVSPGLKFAYQSFMLEVLIQLPLEQEQNGNQLEREPGGLFGLRYLF